MSESFTLWGLTGYRFGLILSGAWVAYLLAVGLLRADRRMPVGVTRVYAALSFPLGILFGRLEYCLVNLRYFTQTLENPLAMLRFWDGGFGMMGVLAGFFLAAFLASRIRGCRFGSVADIACVPMGLFLAGERLAEGYTSLGVGMDVSVTPFVTRFPWLFVHEQVGAADIPRLAVFRYEALMALLITAFLLVLYIGRHHKRHARPGDLALVFYALYGATQIVMESLRDDGHLLFTFFRVGQLCAVLLPILAMIIFTRRAVRIHGARCWQWISWIGSLVCIGLLIALEFAIDGRLELELSLFGLNGTGLYYLIMALTCLLLFLFPYVQWRQLKNTLYRGDHIGMRLREEPRELPL